MNPLVAKEIRLLLPAYVMGLLLAVVPAVMPRIDPFFAFGFAAIMLALCSFGREFSLRTFPLALAQPIERRRVWWIKITVLVAAMATLFGVWCFTFAFRFYNTMNHINWHESLSISGMIMVVVFAGALWTTLLLRQVIAAFWFTILVPATILMIVNLSGGKDAAMYATMGVYSAVGFWLAWWQFSRAQETAWTGGIITFPAWRKADSVTRSGRTRRPLTALFWKELQLHQLGLMGMGGLFLLHLGVVWLRKPSHAGIGDMTRAALEVFGGLWFIVPALTGCTSVSEERKLGMMQELLCLPVSRRVQFFIKLLVTLIVGGLLSATLLWTAEGIGGMMGAGHGVLGTTETRFALWTLILLFLGFLALALIGFYASTLAQGIVQALAAAIATMVVLGTIGTLISMNWTVFGVPLWRGGLVHYIAWPTLVVAGIWLAWRNFKSVSENWPFWRRNLMALAATLVFTGTTTTAIYNRVWELVTKPEPAHGPARLKGPYRAALHVDHPDYNGNDDSGVLLALLPDGRLWQGLIGYDPGRPLVGFAHKVDAKGINGWNEVLFVGGRWHGFKSDHFVSSSNWVDAVATFWGTVAIRANGTLWASEKSLRLPLKNNAPLENDEDLVRVGSDIDWDSVVQAEFSLILLKRDGTLWQWGRHGRSLRASGPQRLGSDSDWTKILPVTEYIGIPGLLYAWKKDGHAWFIHHPHKQLNAKANEKEIELKPGELVMDRAPELDNANWRSIVSNGGQRVGLREDGTLWHWRNPPNAPQTMNGRGWNNKIAQIGNDTNWLMIVGQSGMLRAIRADGSLWAWNLSVWQGDGQGNFSPAEPPIRLSRNSDWMAVGYSMGGIVALAADGSLWHWWNPFDPPYENYFLPLPRPSRKPSKIENILAKEK